MVEDKGRFHYLRGSSGRDQQTVHANLSPLDRYRREQSGQFTDLHHPQQSSQPAVDRNGRPLLTPVQIQRALRQAKEQTASVNPRVHPDVRPDWRIPDLPEGRRKRNRRNGRGSQGGPYVNRQQGRKK